MPDAEAAKDLPLRAMINTCVAEKGVGLAANQVGIEQRVIVVKPTPALGATVMINPKLTMTSDDVDYKNEGCLSYPGTLATVKRSRRIEVEYRDRDWNLRKRFFVGFPARVIQHEIDHLDGICKVGDEWRRQGSTK